jgi:hypothetical protein
MGNETHKAFLIGYWLVIVSCKKSSAWDFTRFRCQSRTERHQSLWHEYEKLYVSNSNRNIWMSRSRAFLLARVRAFTAKNPFPCLPRAFNNRARFFIVYLLRMTKIASPNSMAPWSHTFQDYKTRWMLLHRESPQIRSRGSRNSKIFAWRSGPKQGNSLIDNYADLQALFWIVWLSLQASIAGWYFAYSCYSKLRT